MCCPNRSFPEEGMVPDASSSLRSADPLDRPLLERKGSGIQSPVCWKWEIGNDWESLRLRGVSNPSIPPTALVPVSLSEATAEVIRG